MLQFEGLPLQIPAGWEARWQKRTLVLEGPPSGLLRPSITLQLARGRRDPMAETRLARHAAFNLAAAQARQEGELVEWSTRLCGLELWCCNLSLPARRGTIRVATACAPDRKAEMRSLLYSLMARLQTLAA